MKNKAIYIAAAAAVLVPLALFLLDEIALREERPWLIRRRADTAQGNRENLLRMIALKERLPELIIVTAHDMRAFAKMPVLSRADRPR